MSTVTDTLEPPRTKVGVLGWLRKNLFNSWFNSILTIVALWIIYVIASGFLTWVFTGAQWKVITDNLRLFMVGPFPPDQVWRVWLVLAIVAFLFGLSAGAFGGTVRTLGTYVAAAFAVLALLPFEVDVRLWLIVCFVAIVGMFLISRGRKRWRNPVLILWLVGFVVTILLLQGFADNMTLPQVGMNQWGGLLLTFILAIISIVVSFPLGVLLALGRRSSLPAIKIFSIAYIEIVRGVPLITILFMAQIMVPLFLPGEIRIDNVVRAIVAFTLFTAAYEAENVRGGLQAIPGGQVEAAEALGLNNFLVTLFIVLPQALRLVIPATVRLFISLFKDTTLATIVAQLEILGVGRSVLAQPEFLGRQTEVYVFIAAIFFVFCYAMSYASYRLEAALGIGKR